jgi:hypothetical protein
VRLAQRIDHQPVRIFQRSAAEISRILQRLTAGIELHHEDVARPFVHALQRALHGEIRGQRAARHIDIALRVACDRIRDVLGGIWSRAAHVRRVRQNRIDNESLGPVIGADLKADTIAVRDPIAASDRNPAAMPLLINHRPFVNKRAAGEAEKQVTVRIHAK